MIVVAGGAGLAVQIKMTPQEEPEYRPMTGDTFDYSTLNVAAKSIGNEDIVVESAGCGFHIAAHLAEMGHEVAFASVVGDDALGLAVIAQLKKLGIDASHVKIVAGATPVKVEMLNILNDPQMAFGNDKLYEQMTPEVAEAWQPLFEKASAIVLDGNLPKETIEAIAEQYGAKAREKDGVRESVKLFFDPASHLGAAKVQNVLGQFYAIMPGRVEAEVMARQTVLSEEQLMEAGALFAGKGVSRTIITIKGGGLYYKEGTQEGILRPERVLSFAGTSGAGDVASAAVIAADLDGKDIEETAAFAMRRAAEFLAGRSDERFVDIANRKQSDR